MRSLSGTLLRSLMPRPLGGLELYLASGQLTGDMRHPERTELWKNGRHPGVARIEVTNTTTSTICALYGQLQPL